MAELEEDEVIVFRDFVVTGLRFPMDPVLIDILRQYNIYLQQLTPNSFVRLNIYFRLKKTCCFSPSAEGFAYAHKIHYQLKTISFILPNGEESQENAQYGCYNFIYMDFVFGPMF